MAVSASEVVEAPGASAPFYLKPILVEMEGGCYMGPILPGTLEDLFAWRRETDGNGSGGGNGDGGDPKSPRRETLGGPRGYRRSEMRTDLPCPFGTGRTCGPS